jgi:hypothetical protein
VAKPKAFPLIAPSDGTPRPPTEVIARGLSSVEMTARSSAVFRSVNLFGLQPYHSQPLDRHSDENVATLRDSIHELGLLNAPLVWRDPTGRHVILAGHRRVRACQLLARDGHRPDAVDVFLLTDLSAGGAAMLAAAEYVHRVDCSTVHTATLIGEAHRQLQLEASGISVSVRRLAAVLPWGKSAVDEYLAIYQALQDPRLADLVRSADKAPISLLCKALRQPDFDAKVHALTTYREGGIPGLRKALSGSKRGRPTRVVRRTASRDGYELTVRLRQRMSRSDAETAIAALRLAIADLELAMQTEMAVGSTLQPHSGSV